MSELGKYMAAAVLAGALGKGAAAEAEMNTDVLTRVTAASFTGNKAGSEAVVGVQKTVLRSLNLQEGDCGALFVGTTPVVGEPSSILQQFSIQGGVPQLTKVYRFSSSPANVIFEDATAQSTIQSVSDYRIQAVKMPCPGRT